MGGSAFRSQEKDLHCNLDRSVSGKLAEETPEVRIEEDGSPPQLLCGSCFSFSEVNRVHRMIHGGYLENENGHRPGRWATGPLARFLFFEVGFVLDVKRVPSTRLQVQCQLLPLNRVVCRT